MLQVYPWVYFNADQLERGHFPLWNHLTGLGQPHLANIQTALFYPLYWLWYGHPTAESYGWLMVFRLWLAALLWFVFARARTASFAGALVTGAAYGMGGYALWFAQLIDLNSQLLLPALLLAWGALWARPTGRRMIGAAALVALVIFGGHPEAAFITLFVGLAYTATMGAAGRIRDTRIRGTGILPVFSSSDHGLEGHATRWARVAAVAGSLALGGLLSLGTTVPFLDYLSRCWTMHGSGFGFIHLDPRGFFNLILPGVHNLFKGMPTELPVAATTLGVWDAFAASYRATAAPGNLPGAGLVVVGLAAVAMARPRRLNRHALFFVGLLACTLGLTFGLPLFRLIAFVPPFNLNSNFKFFFSEIHAALAVLAGVGVDQIYRKLATKKEYQSLLFISFIVLIAFIMIFVPMILLFFIFDVMNWIGDDKEQIEFFFLYILPSLPLLVMLVAFMGKKDAEQGAVAVLFLSLFLGHFYVRPFIQLKSHLPVRLASLVGSEDRVEGLGGLIPANLLSLYHVKDIRSSDALFYRPYMELLNKVNGFSSEQSIRYFYPSYYTQVSGEKLLSPEAAALGMKFVFAEGPFQPRSIIDQAVIRGHSIYQEAPPANQPFPSKSGNNGLFLHPPANIAISLPRSEGELAFSPRKGGGDVIFQALAGDKLIFSRWVGLSYENEIPEFYLPVPGKDITLSTLPGPLNNRDMDWAYFIGLSFYPDGYQQPPIPIWTDGKTFSLYKLNGLSWAHLDGDTAALPVTRSAGDEVAIEVAARKGGDSARTLIVHEVWYPGWTAEIDGRPARIDIPADKVSWRLQLPPAPQSARPRRVVFRFVPWDFRIGLAGAVATALVSLVAFAFFRLRSQR